MKNVAEETAEKKQKENQKFVYETQCNIEKTSTLYCFCQVYPHLDF